MSRKSPSQSKNLNDTHDLMTLMTHVKSAQRRSALPLATNGTQEPTLLCTFYKDK